MAKTASRISAPAKKAAPAATKTPASAKTPARTTTSSQPPSRQEVAVPDDRLRNLPAHMQADAGMGLEHVGAEDLEIPRLKLIQGISKELQEYNDLRAGNFFHTASETIFDEPFRVVPILFQKMYILWNPLDSGGGILARADDAVHWSPSTGTFKGKLDKKDGGGPFEWKLAKTVQESGLANWGTLNASDSNSPPAATLMYNFLFGFPDNPELSPAVFTFQRSSIKAGRKFLSKLKIVRTPIFGTMYEMSSVDDGQANREFKNVNMKGVGLVDDADMYGVFKDLHMAYSSKGLNIKDIDSLSDEDGANAGDDDGGSDKPKY